MRECQAVASFRSATAACLFGGRDREALLCRTSGGFSRARLGCHRRVIEHDEHISGAHAVAGADADLHNRGDNPAGQRRRLPGGNDTTGLQLVGDRSHRCHHRRNTEWSGGAGCALWGLSAAARSRQCGQQSDKETHATIRSRSFVATWHAHGHNRPTARSSATASRMTSACAAVARDSASSTAPAARSTSLIVARPPS